AQHCLVQNLVRSCLTPRCLCRYTVPMPGPDPVYEYVDSRIAEAVGKLRAELLSQVSALADKYDQMAHLLVETRALVYSKNAVDILLHADKVNLAKQVDHDLQEELECLRGKLKDPGDPLALYAEWHSRSKKKLAAHLGPEIAEELFPQTRDMALHQTSDGA
ncbi:MAG: hypothetical protein NTU41_07435, partial [Chloroflexi bacterium]|nr:hypothetical protein [Chloroflexota bacterium]